MSADDAEKHHVQEDNLSSSDQVDGLVDPDANLSPEEKQAAERKLLWKLDWSLMPWVRF